MLALVPAIFFCLALVSAFIKPLVLGFSPSVKYLLKKTKTNGVPRGPNTKFYN